MSTNTLEAGARPAAEIDAEKARQTGGKTSTYLLEDEKELKIEVTVDK